MHEEEPLKGGTRQRPKCYIFRQRNSATEPHYERQAQLTWQMNRCRFTVDSPYGRSVLTRPRSCYELEDQEPERGPWGSAVEKGHWLRGVLLRRDAWRGSSPPRPECYWKSTPVNKMPGPACRCRMQWRSSDAHCWNVVKHRKAWHGTGCRCQMCWANMTRMCPADRCHGRRVSWRSPEMRWYEGECAVCQRQNPGFRQDPRPS